MGNDSQSISRRDFLKLISVAGTIMTFAPFVGWDQILANASTAMVQRAKAQLPDGSHANINTFPIIHSEVVIYPKTDDPLLNKDVFRTWQLIRLPAELGGDKNDVSAFRGYIAAYLRADSAFDILAILEGDITRSKLSWVPPIICQYCNSKRLTQ